MMVTSCKVKREFSGGAYYSKQAAYGLAFNSANSTYFTFTYDDYDNVFRKDTLNTGTWKKDGNLILLKANPATHTYIRNVSVKESSSGNQDSTYINITNETPNILDEEFDNYMGTVKTNFIEQFQYQIILWDTVLSESKSRLCTVKNIRLKRSKTTKGIQIVVMPSPINWAYDLENPSFIKTKYYHIANTLNNTFDVTIENLEKEYFKYPGLNQSYMEYKNDTLIFGDMKYSRIPDSIMEKYLR